MPLSEKDKKIAYSILQHLKSQISNRVIEDEEGIESLGGKTVLIAIQCIAATYGLEHESENQKYSTKATIEELFSKQQYLTETVEAENQVKAEELKEQGNVHLKEGRYQEAVDCYSKAIDLVPNSAHSATYYCNRAAAYIKLQEHQKALQDCDIAIAKNPNYARAYARKGSVCNLLSKWAESKGCFTKALELEPQNETYRLNLEEIEQRIKNGEVASSGPAPHAAGGGAAPGGPFGAMGGGLPNLGGMNLGNLLSNPAFMNMASSLMQSPAFQNIASQMMGGQPGAPGTPGMAGMMPQFQQATQQLQQENPELYETLRRQAAQVGTPPPNPSNPK